MSSIAYVTDQQMIEFHRIHAHHTMNFWKPSNAKKISDFKKGDYLFFLAKGTEKGKRREKGLVGYGKLNKSTTLTFTQMWNRFGLLNGYQDKESLEEAIVKITKNHQLPKQLNCFYLEEVTFFQAPVYLSEIEYLISNKVESYIYLDKEDVTTTSKILEIAHRVGEDLWSSMYEKNERIDIIKDAQYNMLMNISDKLKTTIYSKYEETRINKYIMSVLDETVDQLLSETEFVSIIDQKIRVYLPCIVNANDFHNKLQYILGHYLLYQAFINMCEYKNEIDVCLLFNQNIDASIKELLDVKGIQYKEKLANS